MKTYLFSSIFFLFCFSAYSKTIQNLHIDGLYAKSLINVGIKTESIDAGVGELELSMKQVHCEKIVDFENAEYIQRCTFSDPYKDVEIKGRDAEDLRQILREVTKNEIKVSPSRKTINLERISCHAWAIGHSLDDIELETTYQCDLYLK
jgi:hypothetical protein